MGGLEAVDEVVGLVRGVARRVDVEVKVEVEVEVEVGFDEASGVAVEFGVERDVAAPRDMGVGRVAVDAALTSVGAIFEAGVDIPGG